MPIPTDPIWRRRPPRPWESLAPLLGAGIVILLALYLLDAAARAALSLPGGAPPMILPCGPRILASVSGAAFLGFGLWFLRAGLSRLRFLWLAFGTQASDEGRGRLVWTDEDRAWLHLESGDRSLVFPLPASRVGILPARLIRERNVRARWIEMPPDFGGPFLTEIAPAPEGEGDRAVA